MIREITNINKLLIANLIFKPVLALALDFRFFSFQNLLKLKVYRYLPVRLHWYCFYENIVVIKNNINALTYLICFGMRLILA